VTGRQWTTADVPEQAWRTAVITGGNTGLGFQVAQILAGRGARVIIACRDREKARRAVAEMATAARRSRQLIGLREGPTPDLHVVELDLARLGSVRDAAAELKSKFPVIDLLINNAGVMMTPYTRTEDGFELQFGTNHLGHFALTGLLLDQLAQSPAGARVVTVSSIVHRRGSIDFDDLMWEHGYNRTAAYARSKLANLLFAYELDRRLTATDLPIISLAAHPGYSSTGLTRNLPPLLRAGSRMAEPLIAQSPAMGALSLLRAATDPEASGGQFYGPANPLQTKGHPKLVRSSARSYDQELARRLWETSEKLTGVSFLQYLFNNPDIGGEPVVERRGGPEERRDALLGSRGGEPVLDRPLLPGRDALVAEQFDAGMVGAVTARSGLEHAMTMHGMAGVRDRRDHLLQLAALGLVVDGRTVAGEPLRAHVPHSGPAAKSLGGQLDVVPMPERRAYLRFVRRLVLAEPHVPVRPEDLRLTELPRQLFGELGHRAQDLLVVDGLMRGPEALRVVGREIVEEIKRLFRPAAERHGPNSSGRPERSTWCLSR
jgi:NAD(P)-dependent dehydrogenase (short-subunit alcohol dehydrogenase family)